MVVIAIQPIITTKQSISLLFKYFIYFHPVYAASDKETVSNRIFTLLHCNYSYNINQQKDRIHILQFFYHWYDTHKTLTLSPEILMD